MTPDELMRAWTLTIYDVFGKNGCFRQEPITFDEWLKLNERWEVMYDMNRKAAMNRFAGKEDR